MKIKKLKRSQDSKPSTHDDIEKLDLGRRRVQKIRGSFYINLPITWIRSNDVKEGSTVEFSMDKSGLLFVQKVREKEASN